MTLQKPMAWLACVTLLMAVTPAAVAGDLPAVSDGEHLWHVEQAPAPEGDKDAGPGLIVYHLPTDSADYQAGKLGPIAGELMPGGVTAGDGRLLIITSDRQVKTIRPVWSELMRRWTYSQRTLSALPDGCTLLSVTMSDRGPWALVRVQSRELLEQLDTKESQRAGRSGSVDRRIPNRVLGLPEGLRRGESDGLEEPDESGESSEASSKKDESPEEAGSDEAEADAEEPAGAPPSAAIETPAYRLIYLRGSKWVGSPLPQGFVVPRKAAMVFRAHDDRPTLIVDHDTPQGRALTRYTPVVPAQRPTDTGEQAEGGDGNDGDAAASSGAAAWGKLATGIELYPSGQWSVGLAKGQVVVALERSRTPQAITVDTFLLRGESAIEIGAATLAVGDDARWAVFPLRNDIGLIASPALVAEGAEAGAAESAPVLAILAGLTLDGGPLFKDDQGNTLLTRILEKQSTAFDGNADLLIQVLAFVTAMFMMVVFYRRAPRPDQIDLPDDLALASFGRRALAGMIDLAPGFFLATLIYDVTVNEIILDAWPGNGVEKVFAAMRPGFVVIGVTLVHTTVMEFILARSLGKLLTGLYVADLAGKPAPPGRCVVRSLSRAFELFAPLMIIVAVISPARQRLGDIFTKTTVVMQKPETPREPDHNDDD